MNCIIFLGKRHELCKAFGLFGKENLIYKSEFDHRVYENSDIIQYLFSELNSDIFFISNKSLFSKIEIGNYKNIIIVLSETDIYNKEYETYRQKYSNCKLVFLWMYGEVFSKNLLEECKKAKLDLILSGSNQFGLEEIGIFDSKLNFKYFYYYIGYYYLTELVNNLKEKTYDKNQLPIFTYTKASNQSSWRSEIINELHKKFPNKIYNGNSINDSYDLEFTKYKHFETINDYSYKNYNLVFETIYYKNNIEYFATEKTFKALFFGNPFFLFGPDNLIKDISKDFYLLNSDFENIDDFVGANDLDVQFDKFQKKSNHNYFKLIQYVKDYSYTKYFKNLLNI